MRRFRIWGLVLLAVFGISAFTYQQFQQQERNEQLFRALRNEDESRAIVLLSAGADPNSIGNLYVDKPPRSIWERFIFLLRTRKQFRLYTGEGTPLMIAAQNGGIRVTRALLDHGANVHARTEYGATPLHFAACYGTPEVVSLSITVGADVNARQLDGETPLMDATWNGKPANIRVLLRHGADVKAKNKKGETALILAKESGEPELISALREGVKN